MLIGEIDERDSLALASDANWRITSERLLPEMLTLAVPLQASCSKQLAAPSFSVDSNPLSFQRRSLPRESLEAQLNLYLIDDL